VPYDWSGTQILQVNTSLPDKRRVLGHADTLVLTDLREWVAAGDREEIRSVIKQLELPTDRKSGTFDLRAKKIWRFVASEIEYVLDPESQKKLDFWQFPAETLALKQGDCEDTSFLLAALLLAGGVSPFCFRVVFGWLKSTDNNPSERHAWVLYKDEAGVWRILESTLDSTSIPKRLPDANMLARPGSRPLYKPDICLNNFHVWQIRAIPQKDVAKFVKAYGQESRKNK